MLKVTGSYVAFVSSGFGFGSDAVIRAWLKSNESVVELP
jgi:hypothetical protein